MKNQQTKTAYDLIKEHQPIEIPYRVWHLFGSPSKTIDVAGNEVSLGGDFGTLQEAREAVEFYVNQLGGKVKWEK